MLVFTQDVIRFKSEKHGTYTATPEAMDRVAVRCLSRTVAELKKQVHEITGYEIDWSDVTSWSALVIILASFDTEADADRWGPDRRLAHPERLPLRMRKEGGGRA